MMPVEVLEQLFGSMDAVAAAGGYHVKSPYAWRHASSRRDPGDLPHIPAIRTYHAALRARGFEVPLDWLVYGVPAAEVAALLASRAAPPAEAA